MGRWPKAMAQLRAERGNQCEYVDLEKIRCDINYGLEFAHLESTGLNGKGRGQSRRVMDIKKNPGSYKLLCKYHHKMFDDANRKKY